MTKEQYLADQGYWSDICGSILGASHDLQPWLNTGYENVVPGDIELVIFSLWSSRKNKGLSIQQQIEGSHEDSILKFITRVALAETEKPINHLVVITRARAQTEKVLCELLRIWFLSDVKSLNGEISMS